MKKGIVTFLGWLLCFGLAACAAWQAELPVDEQNSYEEQLDIQNGNDSLATQAIQHQKAESSRDDTKISETREKTVKLIIDGQELSVTLYDTPTANALYDMLPLELTFEDFNGIEKIAYMDCELPTEGEPDGCDPDEGDFCLYAPWGNLSIFYQDFRYSDALIKLGHMDSGMEMINNMNEDFSATLEKAQTVGP